MWPGLIRRPSLLRELLSTLKLLLAAQQESNLLMRELLLNQGKAPATPQLTYPQLMGYPGSTSNVPLAMGRKPIDSRVRTRNDVATTMDLPTTQDDRPDREPEPPDA